MGLRLKTAIMIKKQYSSKIQMNSVKQVGNAETQTTCVMGSGGWKLNTETHQTENKMHNNSNVIENVAPSSLFLLCEGKDPKTSSAHLLYAYYSLYERHSMSFVPLVVSQ